LSLEGHPIGGRATHRVNRTDKAGKITVLADTYDGSRLIAPNTRSGKAIAVGKN
jgi:hypothetical protein